MSSDQIYALRIFKQALGDLPFDLLSDWMREASRAYGVLNEKNGVASRSVFVLDRDHRISYQNVHFEASNRGHYEEVLSHLEGLKK